MNKFLLIAFLSLFINACTVPTYLSNIIPTPYKADVQQGSVLNRFDINQLKIGMSKHQVRDIIGYPSIIDPFHNNQWDYINHSSLGSGEIINYRLTLTFEQEKLININTNGIGSLPALKFIEKVAENNRINNEKAAIKAKIAAKRLAQEKIKAEKAQALAIKLAQEKKAKAAKEKAEIAAIKLAKEKAERLAQENALKAAKDIALAKEKALKEKQIQEVNKP
ncbi:Outer membrane beta-barrel assembly protein BamE [uncultured Gammaproteobacteria bacterium]|nr:Outer membrane beta-barrel assembly protein BamE [uncultured Gammaproteobacteria bacterium]